MTVDEQSTVECIEQLRAELRDRDDTVANLHIALTTSRIIGTAIGIVMSSQHRTATSAFDELVRCSQRLNIKVNVVAHHVVETGIIPSGVRDLR